MRVMRTQWDDLLQVPKAKPSRKDQPKWEWTEASVWTERMLATLAGGIKGGRWVNAGPMPTSPNAG